MYHYSIFGACLRSEIDFPELQRVSACHPAWTLRVSLAAPPVREVSLIGSRQIRGEVSIALYRVDDGLRLHYDDTGTFDFAAGGRVITWYRNPNASPPLARLDILGRVMSVALHAGGVFCLQGSAVSLPGGTIAFAAPKRHGKSTLATALTTAGAQLVSDDTIPVDLGPPTVAWPGVHCVRLWEDPVDAPGSDRARDPAALVRKHTVVDLPVDRRQNERSPLAAIYLLAPVVSVDGNGAVRRRRLQARHAAVALVGQSKIGDIAGKEEAARLLEQAAALAGRVPVYTLEVVRNVEHLPEVVSQLLAWHEGSARGAVGRPA
jgi:hypothetical protein